MKFVLYKNAMLLQSANIFVDLPLVTFLFWSRPYFLIHIYVYREVWVSYALTIYIDCGYSSIFGAVLCQTLWMIHDN